MICVTIGAVVIVGIVVAFRHLYSVRCPACGLQAVHPMDAALYGEVRRQNASLRSLSDGLGDLHNLKSSGQPLKCKGCGHSFRRATGWKYQQIAKEAPPLRAFQLYQIELGVQSGPNELAIRDQSAAQPSPITTARAGNDKSDTSTSAAHRSAMRLKQSQQQLMALERLWGKFHVAADQHTSHAMWCGVIRAIAGQALARRRWGPNVTCTDPDENADELACEWLENSMPSDATLCEMTQRSFFQEISMAWHEKMFFGGDACGFADDLIFDLQEAYGGGSYYSNSDFTAELVEEYFIEWRWNFLAKVLGEISLLHKAI